VRVKAALAGVEPLDDGRRRYRYALYWTRREEGTDAPAALPFAVRATLDGFCRPGEAPPGACKPPEGASVTVRVERR
jgi:hypothetical protein